MFSIFNSNPVDKLKKKRKKLLEEAMHVQRSGDLKLYAQKMQEVENIQAEIDKLNAE